ncbi:MAG TPA: hypothetical protein VK728_09620 [Candidatus Sulfotelmatobacter sp.]|nr:hypothetical protein [Candidatus Sulfotelmatobacter sp.]
MGYAESLYEAVLRGLNRLADSGWESETGETVKQVEVEIHQEPTTRVVNVQRLLKWAIRARISSHRMRCQALERTSDGAKETT